MKRGVIALIAVLVAFPGVAALMWGRALTGPTYTLAQVQAGLYRTPRAWVGRIVRVRAQIDEWDGLGPGSARAATHPSRYDNLLATDLPPGSAELILGPPPSLHPAPSTSYPAVSLIVSPRQADTSSLLSWLRRVSLVRRLLPVPDFEATPHNLLFTRVFVLRLLPRGQAFDATLLDVE